jgi:hypothetical protein
MVDEQLLVRPAEKDRVYPTVVFWTLITLGLAVCWQAEAPIAETVTFCPLTVMVGGEACSWICTVLETPGSGSPKVSLSMRTETVDEPEG